MNEKFAIDKHIQTYLEETTEMLSDLELSLMGVENSSDDFELLNQIFRTLHTIKGSSGMFGFDIITAFTHDIETVYDQIRNGSIKITKEIVDLTLAAKDQISLMIQSRESSKLYDEQVIENILSSFRNITASFQNNISNDTKSQESESGEAQNQKMESYYIKFRPHADLFLTGTNPILLLNEVRELGKATITARVEEVPLFDNLDPEQCCTWWEISLETDKGINSIKDIFIFVEDNCELEIKYNQPEEKKENGKELLDPGKKIKDLSENHHDNTTVSSLRVSAEKLDELVNLVGELVTTQARLSQLASVKNDPSIVSVAEEVERLTWSLRDSAMNIRMLPIGSTFNRFIRLVRDLSKDLGKEVELTTDGAETELDKTVIEHLNDPLIHIIRNSIDHGIESPDEREKARKPRVGKIHLSATQSGGNVLVTITDDGAGMDRDAIKAKAVKMGLISESSELRDSEIYALVLSAGFSTAKTVTNISGRGVGMDVVKRAIDNLRGTIEITSSRGTGTSITLKLPLTLAIIDGLLVGIADDQYVLPLSSIEECIELSRTNKENAHGRYLVNVRGNIIPYISLREKFSFENDRPDIEQIVIANVNNTRIGFAVDNVFGQHQTVLKSLGRFYKNVQVISGATILGDGTVALILDIRKLIQNAEIEEKILNDNIGTK